MAYSPKPPLTEPTPAGPATGGGDLHAWVLQYGPALRRYFLRRASPADVDDLVQEVFLMMQVRGATCEIDNVEGYLFRTAANVLGQRRRRASWSWGRQEDLDDVEGLADEISPERILIGKETYDAMMEALRDLPPRSALAFMLFRVDQLPQEVIARRMGISVRAVQALVQRAANGIFERLGVAAMTLHLTETPVDAIRQEAMAWRVRREAAELSPVEQQAFSAWMARSPEHRAVYAEAEEFWTAAGHLGRHPLYAETRQWAARAVDRARTTRRALAAGLAAAVIGLGGLTLYLQDAPRPLATQDFRTAVGQQATVTLPDGSQVTLNTDTVVRTRADENRRLVYLEKGQAFFKVAKDPRHPFVVTAAGRTVTALGTAFDVRVDRGELKVVLVEGKVRVELARAVRSAKPAASAAVTPPMATDMSAGSQLVAVDDTEWRLTPTNVGRETSWLTGQLVFDDESLGDIVDEMNRYSARKITLDDSLSDRRLSGNFTPGDVHGFARMLRAAGFAALREQPSGEIEIVAVN